MHCRYTWPPFIFEHCYGILEGEDCLKLPPESSCLCEGHGVHPHSWLMFTRWAPYDPSSIVKVSTLYPCIPCSLFYICNQDILQLYLDLMFCSQSTTLFIYSGDCFLPKLFSLWKDILSLILCDRSSDVEAKSFHFPSASTSDPNILSAVNANSLSDQFAGDTPLAVEGGSSGFLSLTNKVNIYSFTCLQIFPSMEGQWLEHIGNWEPWKFQ